MLLYKYFPPTRGSFLKKLLIRFTPPDSFNDPFDCLLFFDGFDNKFIRERVEKVGLDLAFQFALEDVPDDLKALKLAKLPEANKILFDAYSSDPTQLEQAFQQLHRRKLQRDIGILCVSKNPRSILMWSHYASEHKGFVVGFNSEDKFFSHLPDEPDDIGTLLPVNYVVERPSINVQKIHGAEPLPDIFFTKNQEWGYEQEFRMLRFLKQADVLIVPDVHLFKVPPTAVREIIIGCNAEPKTVGDLRDSRNENPALEHLKFFKAALSRKQFEMDISPL